MNTVFSGIQPSGQVHLGNILGAIKNWVEISKLNSNNYFCVVDLHSLTGNPNSLELRKSIQSTLKVLFASGIELNNSVIYSQSKVQEHAYLSWILSSFCQVGELQRMTQFKEKASAYGTHSGLLTYPILMAADILLHKANEVPVGDDQTQHLELTRNIADRFNNKFGNIFPIPEKTTGKYGTRIMSLRHPEKKMSKSSDDLNGTIYITDDKDTIIKKFKSSVTDSENNVNYDELNKPGISNLIEIYSAINNITIDETVSEFQNVQYGEFKIAVAEVVSNYIEPIRKKLGEITDDQIHKFERSNIEVAKNSAQNTIASVEEALGIK